MKKTLQKPRSIFAECIHFELEYVEKSYFGTCYCQISETEMLTIRFSLFWYFEQLSFFFKRLSTYKRFYFYNALFFTFQINVY